MVRIIFIHPDLGIGGAERAVIDAALALKSRGHHVEFITSHHDDSHCFSETIDGSFTVSVVGNWLPRNLFGYFFAMCAYLRMIYAAIFLVFFSGKEFDLIFCDQISACIPFLKWSNKKVLFYCHFPDMLLTTRKSWLKKMYRKPIDWLEERTTGKADVVLVNSRFTAEVFKSTFKSLSHINPEILYPIPNFDALNLPVAETRIEDVPHTVKVVFLSINRYERKKNLKLALEALGDLKGRAQKNELDFGSVHLIMAGGYDERVVENKEHYLELRHISTSLGLDDNVTFLRSFDDAKKRTLLTYSSCLLYTPDREHFGIVPIEAMYLRCPVIAVKSGGPLETVSNNETGFLCDQTPVAFSEAMEKFITDSTLSKRLGDSGRTRVETKFSFDAFTRQLDRVVTANVM